MRLNYSGDIDRNVEIGDVFVCTFNDNKSKAGHLVKIEGEIMIIPFDGQETFNGIWHTIGGLMDDLRTESNIKRIQVFSHHDYTLKLERL
jgi:hypothetical protein